jgi:protein-tyrosine phosphatase
VERFKSGQTHCRFSSDEEVKEAVYTWLRELELSRQIFKKFSNVEFHENPSSGSRVVPCRWTDRTDRHDEANGFFSQFYNNMSEIMSVGKRVYVNCQC